MKCPVHATDRHRTALLIDGRPISYGVLDASASRFASGIVDGGLMGRRFAIRAPASWDVVALHVAAARTGTTLVPLNTRLRPEQQQALADSVGAWLCDDVASLAIEANLAASDIDDHHETLLFTSGTTGASKAARIQMHNLVVHSRAACSVVNATADDTWLLCLPLFHIGGIAMMWRALLTGATLQLLPEVDVDVIARCFAEGSAQHASLVPTTLQALLPKLTTVSPRVKAVLIGGGPVPEHLLVEARARGLPVAWTWGMTETTSQAATALTTDPPQAKARPLPGIALRIVDDNGVDVDHGVVGNVCVKGDAVFSGYVDADAKFVDGFFVTGDLGVVDEDGHLAIVSRRTDLIVSGGENLYPVQIEEALLRCPAVADVGVAPIDDDKWGQRPHAVVVLRAGGSVADVEAFARATLARIQIPDRFVVVAALPRNALGKLDRRLLKSLCAGPMPAA